MNFVAIALFIALLWGVQPVIHKYLLKDVDYVVLMIVSSIVYFACVLGFTVYNWKVFSTNVVALSPANLGIIAVMTVFTAFIANLLYFFVLKDHASYVTSALIYASPVFTLVVAVLFLKEKVSLYGLAGVLLIVAGVVVLALNDRRQPESFLIFPREE